MRASLDELAAAIRELLRQGYVKRRGMCRPRTRLIIASDPELTAFLLSVGQAGEDSWDEEYRRVRHRQRRYATASEFPPDDLPGSPALSRRAIKELIPVWREWGRLLIDARQHH